MWTSSNIAVAWYCPAAFVASARTSKTTRAGEPEEQGKSRRSMVFDTARVGAGAALVTCSRIVYLVSELGCGIEALGRGPRQTVLALPESATRVTLAGSAAPAVSVNGAADTKEVG